VANSIGSVRGNDALQILGPGIDSCDVRPDGRYAVEVRRDGTVARLTWVNKLMMAGRILMAQRIIGPRVAVLTPRPIWTGQFEPDQDEGLLVAGQPTYVDEVGWEKSNEIIEAMFLGGTDDAIRLLTELLYPTTPAPKGGST
jgi:hypothetical protein